MSAKLDKTQPYGHITGDTEGRVYEQDGRYFTVDGKPWRDPKKKESAEERAAREADEKAAAEAAAAAAAAAEKKTDDDQLAAQLGNTTIGKVS